MQVAITICGVVLVCALLIVIVCCVLVLVAKAFERAARDTIRAAHAEERARIACHYFSTSWWFSEYPDVQQALKLVTQEIVSGRCDSSQLRADWIKETGRKP